MMTQPVTARSRILQRLRAAKAEAVEAPDLNAFYSRPPPEDLQTRVEKLVLNLSNAMAQVKRTTPAGLAETVAQVLQEKALHLVAVGPEILARQDLCDRLKTDCTLLPIDSVRAEEAALFNEVDVGLTWSHAAIAETGSVVLRSSPQSPRTISLVPPVHIVIVDAQHTYATLFELMQQEGWSNGLPTNVILVSSPSKTADIQQTLAYGAHGPKELVVILVESQA